MKRPENYEKELAKTLEGKISEREIRDFADGLRSIRQIIFDNLKLKTTVDFETLTDLLVCTYRAELRGEMKVLLGNKLIKAPRILGSSTIYRLIPQIWSELNSGVIRPEFRFTKSEGKFLRKKMFIARAGKGEATIRNKIEDGTIPNEMIIWGRKRGRGGREIESISREALKYFKK